MFATGSGVIVGGKVWDERKDEIVAICLEIPGPIPPIYNQNCSLPGNNRKHPSGALYPQQGEDRVIS